MTLQQLVFILGLIISILMFVIGNSMDINKGNFTKKSLLQAVGLAGIITYAIFLIGYACLFVDWNYKIF